MSRHAHPEVKIVPVQTASGEKYRAMIGDTYLITKAGRYREFQTAYAASRAVERELGDNAWRQIDLHWPHEIVDASGYVHAGGIEGRAEALVLWRDSYGSDPGLRVRPAIMGGKAVRQ